MKKQIVIDFAPDGSIKMNGEGFKGTECDAAMKKLEDALGTQTERINKPEYRQAQSTAATQAARN